ncbi:signal peptidase II [Aeoliella sp.]|uniref:signal peptidase II n=1 Tax=Aeoliella sp. TaxID=2795800 RepID=UPI003CCC297B
MSKQAAKAANPYASGKAESAEASSLSYPRSRIALFVLPAVLGLAADLVSKWWMFSQPGLRFGEIWWVINDYAGFQLSLNQGALFGMGQGLVWLFATFGIAAAVALPIWLFRFGAATDALLTFALGCVMAGILGNLYDRLGLHGEEIKAVRDFILLQWGADYRWPNFNIADMLLVIGAAIVFYRSLFQPDKKAES